MELLLADKKRDAPENQFRIDKIGNVLLLIYVFVMPFTSAFSFTGTISLPLIMALLLFILIFIDLLFFRKNNFILSFDLLSIYLFLITVIFSFIINGSSHQKSFNHTIAYISSYLLFYVAIKHSLYAFVKNKKSFANILKILAITTSISAVFSNIEFISDNFFNQNLNIYIPRPTEEEMFYEAGVLGVFHRARGFASESGALTFMMELFSPVTIYYYYFSGLCLLNKYLKMLSTILIISTFIFAASTASFLIVPISFLLSSVFYFNKIKFFIKIRFVKIAFYIGIISILIVLVNVFWGVFFLIGLSIIDKIDSGGFNDRQERILFFYQQYDHFMLKNKLIGIGPAGFNTLGYDNTKSILSLYYNTIFETGILGMFFLGAFLVYIFFNTIKIRNAAGFFFLAALFAGGIHYYISNSYWSPWYWFIAALSLFYKEFVMMKIEES